MDGGVGHLTEGLQVVTFKNGDGGRAACVIADEQETAVSRKCQRLRADGGRKCDLIERGIEEKKPRSGVRHELYGKAAAVWIRGDQRNCSLAEGVGSTDEVASGIEDSESPASVTRGDQNFSAIGRAGDGA